jgi:hypothetical protein
VNNINGLEKCLDDLGIREASELQYCDREDIAAITKYLKRIPKRKFESLVKQIEEQPLTMGV